MATLTKAMIDDLPQRVWQQSLPFLIRRWIVFNLDFLVQTRFSLLKDSFSVLLLTLLQRRLRLTRKTRLLIPTDTGEYKMAGQIPSVATEVLDYFMTMQYSTDSGQDGNYFEG